jgi:hypothetical protein
MFGSKLARGVTNILPNAAPALSREKIEDERASLVRVRRTMARESPFTLQCGASLADDNDAVILSVPLR